MTVTVGCDPEFVLYDKEQDKMVRTTTVFIPSYYSTSLCTQEDSMGCELRPTYSSKPRDVVHSLRDIISGWRGTAERHRLLDRYQLAVGAYCTTHPGQSIGGHIHVGTLPPTLLRAGTGVYGWTPFRRRLFLGASYLWLLEDPDTTWKRRIIPTNFYGGLWENRGLPNPAKGTMEIRHLSSDWVAHPRLMELGLRFVQKIADAETTPDQGEIDSLVSQYGALFAEPAARLPAYAKRVKAFVADLVPADLFSEIEDFAVELRTRRRKDGTIILKEEEWNGR